MPDQPRLHDRIAAELRQHWEGRPPKEIGAPAVADFIAGQAMEILQPELDRLRDQLTGYEQLFELQWRRSVEADALWRAEDPEARANVSPDLGALLTWLMARAATAEQLVIPKPIVPYGPDGIPPEIATADYLRELVRKIDTGYTVFGGSNVTATMRKLICDVEAALRAIGKADTDG